MKRAHYDTLAAHDLDYWWFRTRHDLVLRMLRARPHQGLLVDVGCGTGGFLRRCLNEESKSAERVLGLDVDAKSVATAQSRGVPADVIGAGGLSQYAFASRPTAMTILDVLEHLDDPVGMLADMRAVSAPGCLLIAMVPAMKALWSPWDDRLGHRRRYDRAMLRSQVSEAGWKVQHVRSLFPSMVIPGVLRARLLKSDKLPVDEFPAVSRPVNCFLHWWTSAESRFPWWPMGSSLAIVASHH